MQAIATGILIGALLAGCSAGTPSAAPSGMISTRAPGVADIAISRAGLLEVQGVTRPEVRWSPVEGAELYRLAVEQSEGASWAWSGTDTSVVLGGGDIEREGPGFALRAEAQVWWIAVAVDGTVLATDRVVITAP